MFIKKNYFIIFSSIIFFHLMGAFFLYQPFPNYDVFMHVGTGFALSFIIYDFLKGYIINNKLLYFLVICVLVFWGVIWELGEYIWDQTISTYFNRTFLQLSIRDTMGDLLMNMIGSLAFVSIHFYKKV